jgi:hypothetical protein
VAYKFLSSSAVQQVLLAVAAGIRACGYSDYDFWERVYDVRVGGAWKIR